MADELITKALRNLGLQAKPLVIAILAVSILIQVHFNSKLAQPGAHTMVDGLLHQRHEDKLRREHGEGDHAMSGFR
jgi:hypothetical protein